MCDIFRAQRWLSQHRSDPSVAFERRLLRAVESSVKLGVKRT